jgi:hypothetical protein
MSGFGQNIVPNVKLDVNGGLALRPQGTTSLTSNNQTLSLSEMQAIYSLIQNLNDYTQRTFSLTSGSQSGQILVLECTGGLCRIQNGAAVSGGGNMRLVYDRVFGTNATLTGDLGWYQLG